MSSERSFSFLIGNGKHLWKLGKVKFHKEGKSDASIILAFPDFKGHLTYHESGGSHLKIDQKGIDPKTGRIIKLPLIPKKGFEFSKIDKLELTDTLMIVNINALGNKNELQDSLLGSKSKDQPLIIDLGRHKGNSLSLYTGLSKPSEENIRALFSHPIYQIIHQSVIHVSIFLFTPNKTSLWFFIIFTLN